ncbi:pentapeptide repeat-containing protein [Roseibacterium beibuensis]|uniref:pentapeptide repeat-containing protein n=1 Tax=[Roseibacterium] beibuensis TaxID=1193142 RepID=UPI00217E4EE4|nr:pentapeptide repeat-containing protein [Roseibacterium beibuensis]MCS6625047.1 pentapeptide repeat-containing protein [Roseibacterium beibuensis]
MKPILTALLIVAAAAAALPAAAQNAGQIARVRGGSSCAGCNLFQGNFSGLEARGLNLSGARLRQADLSLSVMNRTRFSNADLRDVEAYGGVFSSASFAGANLSNASFVGAYLDGANFSGATLSGANFAGASLERATGLTQSRLNQACGDEATTLPGGLSIPHC